MIFERRIGQEIGETDAGLVQAAAVQITVPYRTTCS